MTYSALRTSGVQIRLLRESDLAEADQVMRLAFGTYMHLPDPAAFMDDGDYVYSRWKADPQAAFGAELDGQIVGSIFATRWGSVGFFGPLSVRPDLWDQRIGHLLLEPVLDLFAQWQLQQSGLFTFAASAKHVGFYQQFGFWPQSLTALMSRPVQADAQAVGWRRYFDVPDSERETCLRACRELTDAVYVGLDVSREINAAADQKLGDTVLLWDDSERLNGLAVCQCGKGSEAGSGTCYIKFGLVRPGANSGQTFGDLLRACEALAAAQGATTLDVGMNLAHESAYRQMRAFGFRAYTQGVLMQKPNQPGYHRPEFYIIDDWR